MTRTSWREDAYDDALSEPRIVLECDWCGAAWQVYRDEPLDESAIRLCARCARADRCDTVTADPVVQARSMARAEPGETARRDGHPTQIEPNRAATRSGSEAAQGEPIHVY